MVEVEHAKFNALETECRKRVVEHEARDLLTKTSTAVFRPKQSYRIASRPRVLVDVMKSSDTGATPVQLDDPCMAFR